MENNKSGKKKLMAGVIVVVLALLAAAIVIPRVANSELLGKPDSGQGADAANGETEKEHVYGNTPGNLLNGGSVVQSGDWIFYYNKYRMGSLYKVRTDGTDNQEVMVDSARFLNVMDDWIYYTSYDEHIYRMRPSGKDVQEISTFRVAQLNVVDDWMFFTKSTIGSRVGLSSDVEIWKMKVDGSELQRVCNKPAKSMVVRDEWIYFNSFESKEEDRAFYRVDWDGNNLQRLGEYAFPYQLTEEWIFYLDNQTKTLHKMTLDGTAVQKVNDDCAYYMNAYQDWIYYTAIDANETNRQIYRIRMDGSEKKQISEMQCMIISITDNLILYQRIDNLRDFTECEYYLADLDGSNRILIK